MKKIDILPTVIIAEIDAWLALAIFKLIGFDLKGFLGSLNLKFVFPYLNWAFLNLPLSLPLFALLFILAFSFLGRKLNWLFQFGKYILAGSLNASIDLAVLNLLMAIFAIATGWYFSLFKAISFLVAVTNSYFWNKLWTFGHWKRKISFREYSYFLSLTLVGFLINVGGASFLVSIVGPQFGLSPKIWANLSAFGAIILAGIWDFSSYKFIVFRK